MIFNLKRLGASGIPVIDFGGDMLSAFSGDKWEAAFLESGTIRFNSPPGDCDIFLVSNGFSGGETSQAGNIGDVYFYGAAGGRGGSWLLSRASLEAGVNYVLSVADTTTLIGGNISLSTANGAQGGNGGLGAVCYVKNVYNPYSVLQPVAASINRQPEKGVDGVFAYNDAEDRIIITDLAGSRFAAGGAGGDAFCYTQSVFCSGNNVGGATGGGNGSRYRSGNITDAISGRAHTGSGGGGGRRSYEGFDTISAAGGSGICLIRKHRGN